MSRLTLTERAELHAEAAKIVAEDALRPDEWDERPYHSRPWTLDEISRRTYERMLDIRERRRVERLRARQAAAWKDKRDEAQRELSLHRSVDYWHRQPKATRRYTEAAILRELAKSQPRDIAEVLTAIAKRVDPCKEAR